jgi:serine/threonine protein kinase
MMDDDFMDHAQGRVGTTLRDKYRIEGVLGVGGMAVVYAATHRNQRRVAVKMLLPELSIHKEIRARFLREGYAANTVDHPGAVAVLDDDIAEDGSAFLVMEQLVGEELNRILVQHPNGLDARAVLAIADPLLAVLAAAHAKSIIHRDIKPSNIFLTEDGSLKVLDFGIARIRDAADGGSATQTGQALGTPAYMAPEQALGILKEIDGTTDVWSVGATLFALASGQLVRQAESTGALFAEAATQPARSLAVAAPHVDSRVVAIVDRALAFDKSARWPDAAAMRQAVNEAYLAMFGTKVSAEPLKELVTAAMALAPTVQPRSSMHPASSPARFASQPTRMEAAGLVRAGSTTAQPVAAGTETEAQQAPGSLKRSRLPPLVAATAAIGVCIAIAAWPRHAPPVATGTIVNAQDGSALGAPLPSSTDGPSDPLPAAPPHTSHARALPSPPAEPPSPFGPRPAEPPPSAPPPASLPPAVPSPPPFAPPPASPPPAVPSPPPFAPPPASPSPAVPSPAESPPPAFHPPAPHPFVAPPPAMHPPPAVPPPAERPPPLRIPAAPPAFGRREVAPERAVPFPAPRPPVAPFPAPRPPAVPAPAVRPPPAHPALPAAPLPAPPCKHPCPDCKPRCKP